MSACPNATNIIPVSTKNGQVLSTRRKGLLKSTAIVAVALATSMVLAPVAAFGADTFVWDASPAAGIQGGAGDWDGVATNWTTNGGAFRRVYPGYSPGIPSPPDVVFEGVGGNVTIKKISGGFINPRIPLVNKSLTFNGDGYVLNGEGIDFNGDTRFFNSSFVSVAEIKVTNFGDVATINSRLPGRSIFGHALIKEGAGTLVLGGDSDGITSGGLRVADGTLRLVVGSSIHDDADVEVSAGTTFDLDTSETVRSIKGAGSVDIAAGEVLTLESATNGNNDFTGIVSGAGTVVLTGSGIQTLSGANTFTGGLTVSGGTLALNSVGAVNNVSVDGTLSIGVSGAVAGTITTTGSVVDYANGVNSAAPIIVSSNTTQLQVLVGTATQSGVISQDVAGRPIEKIGAGTLILTAANTYTGATTISAGTLVVTGTGSIASTLVNINGAGTLQVDTGALVPHSVVQISGAGTFDVDGSTRIDALTGATGTTVDIAAGQTLIIESGSPTANMQGVIQGDGGVTKLSSGVQTFSGVNTYSGATFLHLGTLAITNGSALGAATGSVEFAFGTLLSTATATLTKDRFEVSATNTGTIAAATGTTLSLAGNVNPAGIISALNFGSAGNTGVVVVSSSNSQHNTARVRVSFGTLRIGGANAADNFLNIIAGTTVAAGAMLDIGGFNAEVRGLSGAGTLTNSGAAATLELIGTGSTFSGIIQDGAGVTSVENVNGTTTLSGINTYTGDTTVSSGTLIASVAGALGSTTVGGVNVTGGTLDLNGATHTKQTLLVTGGDVINGAMNVTGLFGDTVGVAATINATGYTLTAVGGTIANLGANGVSSTNNTAAGLSFIGSPTAPAINNAAGHGIQLANSVGGDVLVTVGSSATGNIAGLGGDGINIVSTGGGTVTVDGGNAAITIRGGNLVGQDGIDITADGNTVVSVAGNIIGDPGVVFASAAGADFTLNNVGNVTGIGDEGVLVNTTGGNGNIVINRDGAVLGTTTGVDARSSNAGAGTGTVTVTSFAGQSITGTNTAGVITRTDAGLNTVNGDGSISGSTLGIDAQALAANGAVTVSGTGATSSSGNGSTTIYARVTAGNGAVIVSRSGALSNTGTGIANGINATNGGTGNVDVDSGSITLNAASMGTGINAISTGAGNVSVDNAGAINGGQLGINAQNNGAGTLTVTLGAAIGDVTAPTNRGIQTSAFSGVTNISGAFNVTGGNNGISAFSTFGAINIIGVGNITTATTNTFTDGAVTISSVGGNVEISNNGNLSGGQGISGVSSGGTLEIQGNGAISGLAAVLGHGITFNSAGGNINIGTTTANGNITGTGANGDGIELISLAGNIAIGQAATASTITGGQDGIEADTTTGNITILRMGTITGTAGDGINAASTGAGNINVAVGAVSGATSGITTSTTAAGTSAVTTTGAVTATAGTGISATAATGSNTVTIGGDVTGTVNGITTVATAGTTTIGGTGVVTGGTDGVSATSTSGAIAVTTGGDVTGTAGSGILLTSISGTGTVTIGAGHTVTGGTSAITNATGTGTTTATNSGTLNAAGTTSNVFTVTSGTFALTNAGTAFGAIQSSAGTTTTFTNNAGSTWTIDGSNPTSTLDGASDTIQNDGTMVSTGTVNFTGVEFFNNTSLNTLTVNGTTTIGPNVVFNNTGRISMQDGAIDDTLNINGTFNASGASTLDVDIDVSQNNAGGAQLADILVLRGGPTTGATTVNFNTLAGTPTLQDNPIIIVDVDAAQANSGSFVDTNGTLPGAGSIIEYQLAQAANGDWVVNSVLNTAAIGSISGSIQSTLSVIGAVVNRPSSPFVASPIAPDPDTCAPGTWGRGTGGRAEIENKSGIPGAAFRDPTTTKIGYQGFQGGLDFGCFNINGKSVDLTAGLTGGFNSGNSSTRLTSSLTSSRFESKFIGGYVSVQKGSFFADLQGRADYSDFKLNNAVVGLTNAKVDSERFSLTGTVAYSASAGEYNLVPAMGGSIARSTTDTVLFDDGSTLKLKDQTDILGFAGITVNRVFVMGGDEEDDDLSAYIPFATVTMYNEFGDTPSSTFTDSGGTQRTIESQNLGLYGEFSAGVNYRKIFTEETSKIREIAASIRGDYKFGQRVQAVGITAQIRFQF